MSRRRVAFINDTRREQQDRFEIKTPVQFQEDLSMTTMTSGNVPSAIGIRMLYQRQPRRLQTDHRQQKEGYGQCILMS